MSGAAAVMEKPISDEKSSGREGGVTKRWWNHPVFLTLLSAAVVAPLIHLRFPYAAGERDHWVLSPLGMSWANPEWFKNDWTVGNVAQPHWFFDVVTWLGSSTGSLPVVYFVYWLAGLTVFGYGTALLANAWAPRVPALMTIVASTVAVLVPVYVMGSGVIIFSTALPNSLGGALMHLVVVAFLLGRNRLALGAAVTIAVIHVQHGAIVAVLVLMAAMIDRVRRGNWDRWLLGAFAVIGLIVFAALQARPVAGHASDFARICQTLIPYHCEASSWSSDYVWGSAAFIGLGCLVIFYLPRQRRLLGFLLIAPAAALIVGTVADRLNIPMLGIAAQGANVYRLSLLFLPLAVWGAVTPIFAPVSRRERGYLLALVLAFGAMASKLDWGLPLSGKLGALVLLAIAGVLALGTWAAAGGEIGFVSKAWGKRAACVGAIGVCVFAVAASHAKGVMNVEKFDIGLYPREGLAEWSAQVQREVSAGSTLVSPPSEQGLRMATKRAIVVDCKYAAYGGEQWLEYQARMNALGGLGQCKFVPRAGFYDGVTADEIVNVAQKYRARYVVVHHEQREIVQSLESKGWIDAVSYSSDVPFIVLTSPKG